MRTLLEEPSWADLVATDPDRALWQRSLSLLTPYPIDNRGYMVFISTLYLFGFLVFTEIVLELLAELKKLINIRSMRISVSLKVIAIFRT